MQNKRWSGKCVFKGKSLYSSAFALLFTCVLGIHMGSCRRSSVSALTCPRLHFLVNTNNNNSQHTRDIGPRLPFGTSYTSASRRSSANRPLQPAAMDNSPFGKLSAELRNEIYSYVLPGKKPIQVFRGTGNVEGPLTRVCKKGESGRRTFIWAVD